MKANTQRVALREEASDKHETPSILKNYGPHSDWPLKDLAWNLAKSHPLILLSCRANRYPTFEEFDALAMAGELSKSAGHVQQRLMVLQHCFAAGSFL